MVFEYLKKPPSPQGGQDKPSTLDTGSLDPNTGQCYDSSSFKESCQTNDKGELICNREKQVWRHCMNKPPVLLSSEKEDNVPGKVGEYQTKVPFEFQDMEKDMENMFNNFMGPDFLGKMFFGPFHLFGQDPFTSFPTHNFPTRPQNTPPPNRPDFPEPEHWRK